MYCSASAEQYDAQENTATTKYLLGSIGSVLCYMINALSCMILQISWLAFSFTSP